MKWDLIVKKKAFKLFTKTIHLVEGIIIPKIDVAR